MSQDESARSDENMSESRSPLTLLRQNWARLLAIILVAVVLAALLWKGASTPDFYRSRGIEWRVIVEDPIPLDAAESLVHVFSAEVERILGIPVHGATFTRIENDGVDQYWEWAGVTGGAPLAGPVSVPLNFFWGEGSSRGQAGPFFTTWWGIGIVTGVALYTSLIACCVPDQIELLLHEFAHNLGLKDLYERNDEGVVGCENLPVMMAEGLGLNLEGAAGEPTGDWLFHFERVNESAAPPVVEARDTYFNRDENVLSLVHSAWWLSDTGVERGDWRNISYDFDAYRTWWTVEELGYLGLPWTSPHSCPQEGLP